MLEKGTRLFVSESLVSFPKRLRCSLESGTKRNTECKRMTVAVLLASGVSPNGNQRVRQPAYQVNNARRARCSASGLVLSPATETPNCLVGWGPVCRIRSQT